jgi:signal transduction histidine kinase
MSDSTVGLAELLRPVRGRLALAVGPQVVAGLTAVVPFIVVAELSEVLLAAGPVDADRAWALAGVAMAGCRRRQEAERTQAEEARRLAGEERMRIARELHDVLAHNISLINVQAGVALHLMDEQPGQSRGALEAIKQASNDALGELRSVLDVLRHGDEAPPRAPASGLAHLNSLVAGVSATGLRVHTWVEGTPRPLPAGVDLAAFRIVQEALTNVTRHAGPATATVVVGYGPDDLTVQVDDDGRGRSATRNPGGNGIRGMRERVAALGGELTTGARPGGGFRVQARFPPTARKGAASDQAGGSGEPEGSAR